MDVYARALEWTKKHYPTRASATGRCAEATLALQAELPSLTRHRGYANGRPHWWLKDGDEIIDPTAAQFDGDIYYLEYDGPEPLGKCYNCGTLLFTREHFCDDTCRNAVMADLNAE